MRRCVWATRVKVVDSLEAVEIDDQKCERLVEAAGAAAGLLEAQAEVPAVGDAGEVVDEGKAGDLATQAVDRHQDEPEVRHHRREDQQCEGNRLDAIEVAHGDRTAIAEQAAHRTHGVNQHDAGEHAAGEVGARAFVCARPRAQVAQREAKRDAFGGGEHGDPKVDVVVHHGEHGQEHCCGRDDGGTGAHRHRQAVELADAGPGEAARQQHHAVADDDRKNRLHDRAQQRHQRAGGGDEGRSSPEFWGIRLG